MTAFSSSSTAPGRLCSPRLLVSRPQAQPALPAAPANHESGSEAHRSGKLHRPGQTAYHFAFATNPEPDQGSRGRRLTARHGHDVALEDAGGLRS